MRNLNNYILNEGYDTKNFASRGKGASIFINKKSLIDLSFSAGSLLLGHNSKIFKNSLKGLISKNISNIAAPNLQALEFSRTLKKVLPNYSKFIFCNSGSESVQKALRICRAITNKKIIINVVGSWHGSNDKTLFKSDKKLRTVPISGGLSKYDKSNLKFIPYDDIDRSKKILDRYRNKICCILIEPIQACLPKSNVKEYLKFLADYSKKNKIILFFDEIITGLRTDCSTVQSLYKIKPDISTLGKSFGGGMPIGIIALTEKIKIKILKQKNKIFFGGTFSGNSISTYVGNKTTQYIIKNRKKIFKNLSRKSDFFYKELSDFIKLNKLNISVYKFKSMLRIIFTKENVKNRVQRDFFESKNLKKINNFRKFLFQNRIYYPSNGIIFISTQTEYKDIRTILKNFKIGLMKYFKN